MPIEKQELKLAEVASRVKGVLLGDPNAIVRGLCPLDEPRAEHLAFTRESSLDKVLSQLQGSPLSSVIISDRARPAAPIPQLNLIAVNSPLAAIVQLIPHFYPEHVQPAEISSKAEIHPTAKLGKNVSIGAFSVIGARATIGDGTRIHPHVVVYHDAQIGAGCELHSGAIVREGVVLGDRNVIQNGAILGADGFGFVPGSSVPGSNVPILKVPQVGTVQTGAEVEIGANACVDRAALGSTRIGHGTKLDNLVQVGHNNKIGKFSIICGQTGIAGSCHIGDGVIIGGSAGIKDHVTVADGVRIGARAGVIQDLLEKGDYAGFPAVRAHSWRRQLVLLQRLLKEGRDDE